MNSRWFGRVEPWSGSFKGMQDKCMFRLTLNHTGVDTLRLTFRRTGGVLPDIYSLERG
jgi:hypothetical protein